MVLQTERQGLIKLDPKGLMWERPTGEGGRLVWWKRGEGAAFEEPKGLQDSAGGQVLRRWGSVGTAARAGAREELCGLWNGWLRCKGDHS